MVEGQLPFEKTFFDHIGGWERRAWERPSGADSIPRPITSSFLGELKNFECRDSRLLGHPYRSQKKPETLLIQDIEALWEPIARNDDWSDFDKKIQAIQSFRGLFRLDSEPS